MSTVVLAPVLWVLDATVARESEFAALFAEITSSEIFADDESLEPTPEERKPPKAEAGTAQDQLY